MFDQLKNNAIWFDELTTTMKQGAEDKKQTVLARTQISKVCKTLVIIASE